MTSPMGEGRRLRRATALLGIVTLAISSALALPSGAKASNPVIRVGVAPFEGDERSPSLAERLVESLSTRPLDRLLAPGDFVAQAGVDVPAEDVRRWAYNAAIESLVVGRVVPATDFEPARIEVVVRSGHSGAAVERFSREIADEASLEPALNGLAEAVLAAVGFVEPAEGTADVAAGPAGEGESGGSSGRGLDASLDLDGFDSGAPIEIKADEAEIVSRNRGRELVFSHNVLVRQANVTLRSDRLEASYKKGESEPERLLAKGRVHVDQGDRHAKCDSAIYLRSEQQLTCRGHAELVQGCDVVRGQSIRFDLDTDRARVEGAASIVIRPEAPAGAPCADGEGML